MIGPISEYQLREDLLAPCRRIVRRLTNRDVFDLGCAIMDALHNWRDRQADASGELVIERIDEAHPARPPVVERRRATDVEPFKCAGLHVRNDVELVLLLIDGHDHGIGRVIEQWGPYNVLAMTAMMSPEVDLPTLVRLLASFTNVFYEGKLRADKGASDRQRGQDESRLIRQKEKETSEAIYRAEARKRWAENPRWLKKTLVLDLVEKPPLGETKKQRWVEGALTDLEQELPPPKS
jgi:hypothetical protein